MNTGHRQPLTIEEIHYDAIRDMNSTGIRGESSSPRHGGFGRFGTNNLLIEDSIQVPI